MHEKNHVITIIIIWLGIHFTQIATCTSWLIRNQGGCEYVNEKDGCKVAMIQELTDAFNLTGRVLINDFNRKGWYIWCTF